MATRREFAWLFRRRPAVQILDLPIDELDEWVLKYIRAIETTETTRNCLCDWRAHPADVDKPKGQRRIARANEHPRCPAHTKEGFLMGFMDYMRKHGS